MLLHLLAALIAIVVAGRLCGRAFRAFGQPPVIGEVVAGILLGPSLVGWVVPAVSQFLFPASVIPSLWLLAQLGVVLYMFLVGVDLNAAALRGRLRATFFIAQTGIAVPFVLGALLARRLHGAYAPEGVPLSHFTLFIGIAMSVTAFPVLARILSDRRMTASPLGVLAMACAAVSDVTAWGVLAFVVGVVTNNPSDFLRVWLLTLAFIAVVFVIVRPLLAWWIRRCGERDAFDAATAGVLVLALSGALATEAIGVHAIFGAFLVGVVVPHGGWLAQSVERQLGGVVTSVLLPAFFALAGLRTELGLLSGIGEWLTCAAIIAVATIGKLGGTVIAARASAFDWRSAGVLGVLMNTRGLMELIVLNVGLDLGILSPTLFTMLVVMALVTTAASAHVLSYVSWPSGATHAVGRGL